MRTYTTISVEPELKGKIRTLKNESTSYTEFLNKVIEYYEENKLEE